jgi:hypothetical protein
LSFLIIISGLADCHGKEFEALYVKYEKEGRARRTIRAQDLWFAILDAQIETGTPYMLVRANGSMSLSWCVKEGYKGKGAIGAVVPKQEGMR